MLEEAEAEAVSGLGDAELDGVEEEGSFVVESAAVDEEDACSFKRTAELSSAVEVVDAELDSDAAALSSGEPLGAVE